MENEKDQPKQTGNDAKRARARERFASFASVALEHLSVESIDYLAFSIGARLAVQGHLSVDQVNSAF